MAIITADVDWIDGHLRWGHYELDLDDNDTEEFKQRTEEGQRNWLSEEGDLIVDDYEINDFGDMSNIKINGYEIKRG